MKKKRRKGRINFGMKVRIVILSVICMLILCYSAAYSEEYAAVHIETGEEWSWDPGSYNLFSGTMQLTPYAGQELTINMTTNLLYGDDKDHNPLFTVVDGKRIPMRQQSNSTVFTPGGESSLLAFSGSIKLPEKGHVKHIEFQLQILDHTGRELTRITDEISVRDNDTAAASGSFYIPWDIGTITIIAVTAAIMIWTVVLLRSLVLRKKAENCDIPGCQIQTKGGKDG